MTKNRYPFVLCIVLLAGLMGTWAAQGVQAQASTGIVRVAPSGSNAAGCGSASNPCQTLQFAVEQLISGSGATRAINGEVRIAAGTYTEGNPAFENIIGIGLPGNLTIRGGYTTSNWNSSNLANATILDGQGSRRGILITVSEAQAAGCAMRVENLSITNGRSSAAEPSGGGILVNNCSSVTVSNVSVRNSIAAGQNNTGNIGLSPGTGGAIAVRGTTNVRAGLTLQNVTLANNQALGGDESNFARGGLGSGGGLYGINAAVVANGLTVTNNTASAGDAPAGSGEDGVQRADGLGGGIGLIQSTFSIANATISQNRAQGGNAAGKGGLALGGAMFIELSNGTITGNTITNNDNLAGNGGEAGSGLGGALFVTDSTIAIAQSNVSFNKAVAGTGTNGNGGGGAIYSTVAAGKPNNLTIDNSVLANNTAQAGPGYTPNGGALTVNETVLNMQYVTIANNTLIGQQNGIGAAMALFGGQTQGTVRNAIVANHATTPIHNNGTSLAFDTILNHNNGGTFADGDALNLVNLFSGNPNFVDATNGDYRIGSGSAAIDTATGSSPSTDVEGQPRPVGSAADVGADEYQVPFNTVAGNTSIGLSWQAPPETKVTHYEIVYTKEAGANNASEGASPIDAGTDTSFNLTGLTKGAEYTITILAYNGQSIVASSATRNVRTGVYTIYLPLVVH